MAPWSPGANIGFSCFEHCGHGFVALLPGKVQGGVASVVGGVDIGASVKECPGRLRLALQRRVV